MLHLCPPICPKFLLCWKHSEGCPDGLWCKLGLSKLVELRLEVDALSSTWIGCLESSWRKLCAGLCCVLEAAASAAKIMPAIAVDCLGCTKLVAVGAAVAAPASLGAVPLLPAYTAPFLACWKLCLLPLAFVGWRLGGVSFTFSL